jgi:thymidylate synthase
MNNLDKQYQRLLQDIIDYGVEKTDRTGTGTKSIFGYTIRHNMKEGFPLLTTKKMAWKSIVIELLWFLKGDTNIKYLVDNDCHIWNGDAYKRYHTVMNSDDYIENWVEPGKEREEARKNKGNNGYTKEEFINEIKTDDEFAKKWGELGPLYGKQWRSWGKKNVINYDLENVKSSDKVKVMDLIHDGGDYSKYDVKVTYQNNSIDQIANLINDLKTNPDSRRLMVNAWNVGELNRMVLPPCHYGFQVYTRELSYEERCDIYKPNTKNFRTETNSYIKDLNIKIMNDCEIPTRAISLMWNQRSVDTFLGLPFNIASYGLLLTFLAKEVNMVPDQLIGNLGDVHLYSNHIEQAKQQIGRELSYEERYHTWFANNYETGFEYNENEKVDFDNPYWTPTPKSTREPYPLPEVLLNFEYEYQEGYKILWDKIDLNKIEILNYQSHPPIKAPLSN